MMSAKLSLYEVSLTTAWRYGISPTEEGLRPRRADWMVQNFTSREGIMSTVWCYKKRGFIVFFDTPVDIDSHTQSISKLHHSFLSLSTSKVQVRTLP